MELQDLIMDLELVRPRRLLVCAALREQHALGALLLPVMPTQRASEIPPMDQSLSKTGGSSVTSRMGKSSSRKMQSVAKSLQLKGTAPHQV